MRMYANNWSLIFIHLILVLQLVLAVIFFKKHTKVSICVIINLFLILIFSVAPFTFYYENAFGRFLFQVSLIVNTAVITLAIFGWRSVEKKGLDPIGISEILRAYPNNLEQRNVIMAQTK